MSIPTSPEAEPETARIETVTAALLYLMTHYARTGCPRLAMCVSGICNVSRFTRMRHR